MYPRFFRSFFATAALAVAGFMPAAPALAAQDTGGLVVPISTGSAAQGTFNGTLKITSFAVQNNALVASGLVSGTVVGPSGALQSIVKTVTIPVATGSTGAATAAAGAPKAAAASTSCGILDLTLGPLDLDLLGLTVHLDRIVLNIGATPGAGNLLGNLLCQVAGLLNNTSSGALTQIANLLNQILAAL